MKQYPSRLKFKKYQKPSYSNLYLSQQKNFHVLRGLLSLKAIENGKLTYNQIEACRKSVRRMIKKQSIVLLRVFTNISLTKKPVAIRMGGGKGNHSIWICIIKKGQIIVELIFLSMTTYNLNYRALKAASSKLPIKTKISSNFF